MNDRTAVAQTEHNAKKNIPDIINNRPRHSENAWN